MSRAFDMACQGIFMAGKPVEHRRKDVVEVPSGERYEVSTSSLTGIRIAHHMLVTNFGKGCDLYKFFETYEHLEGKDISEAYIDGIADHIAVVEELAGHGNPKGLIARMLGIPAHREYEADNGLVVRADLVIDSQRNVFGVSTSQLPFPFLYDETLVTDLTSGNSGAIRSPHETGLVKHLEVLEGLKSGNPPSLYRA